MGDKLGKINEERKEEAINGGEVKEWSEIIGEEVKEEKKKKQAISKSYTLKQMKNNTDKLRKTNLITEEEEKLLIEIQKRAVQKYITEDF